MRNSLAVFIFVMIISVTCVIVPIRAQPENFVFIHLTDTHIGNTNSEAQLQEAINEINSINPLPDFVVITVDLTQDGKWDQFTTFNELVDHFIVPVYMGRGNHDAHNDPDGTYFQQYFGDLYYSFDYDSHHFIMLDSNKTSNPPYENGHMTLTSWLGCQETWLLQEQIRQYFCLFTTWSLAGKGLDGEN